MSITHEYGIHCMRREILTCANGIVVKGLRIEISGREENKEDAIDSRC